MTVEVRYTVMTPEAGVERLVGVPPSPPPAGASGLETWLGHDLAPSSEPRSSALASYGEAPGFAGEQDRVPG